MDHHIESRDPLHQLNRSAEQLEKLAPFMSRADARIHVMEKAAEFRATAALIRAGARPAANPFQPFQTAFSREPGERRLWT